jgi:hypothetical protein
LTNRTSFICGNRNGHHNMGTMKVKTHNRTTQKTFDLPTTLDTDNNYFSLVLRDLSGF